MPNELAHIAQYTDVWRTFQFDYVYVDFVFWLCWLMILLWLREYRALTFGAIIAPLIFAVDAGVWWHSPTADPSVGAFVREYWIGGTYVSHEHSPLFITKLMCDFMMTVSYAFFAFPWLWIAFRAIVTGQYRRVLALLGLWATFWLATPVLSAALVIDDTPIRAVRHMQGVYPFWIGATVLGYLFVAYVYRRTITRVLAVFVVGAVGALVMEIPLHLTGIRPFDPGFIAFEAAVLLNQAVPFLFLLYDKVLRPRMLPE